MSNTTNPIDHNKPSLTGFGNQNNPVKSENPKITTYKRVRFASTLVLADLSVACTTITILGTAAVVSLSISAIITLAGAAIALAIAAITCFIILTRKIHDIEKQEQKPNPNTPIPTPIKTATDGTNDVPPVNNINIDQILNQFQEFEETQQEYINLLKKQNGFVKILSKNFSTENVRKVIEEILQISDSMQDENQDVIEAKKKISECICKDLHTLTYEKEEMDDFINFSSEISIIANAIWSKWHQNLENFTENVNLIHSIKDNIPEDRSQNLAKKLENIQSKFRKVYKLLNIQINSFQDIFKYPSKYMQLGPYLTEILRDIQTFELEIRKKISVQDSQFTEPEEEEEMPEIGNIPNLNFNEVYNEIKKNVADTSALSNYEQKSKKISAPNSNDNELHDNDIDDLLESLDINKNDDDTINASNKTNNNETNGSGKISLSEDEAGDENFFSSENGGSSSDDDLLLNVNDDDSI